MICRNCGTDNPQNMNFCCNCGAPLNVPVVQETYNQPSNNYVPPVPPIANTTGSVPGTPFAIAGLICGICSLVLFFFWMLSMDLAIAGLVFSIIGYKKASNAGRKNGMALSGIICSSIGLFISIIGFIIWIVAIISGVVELSSQSYYF